LAALNQQPILKREKNMTQTIFTAPPPKINPRAKLALGFMAFLLRRDWMGPASDMLMVITTTGRKSGKRHSIPIGYIRDGDDIVVLSSKNPSNWFRNVLANGTATLEIKKEKFEVRGELITDETERQRIFAIHKLNTKYFKANFKVELDSPESVLQEALAERIFIRFKKI
jgi:deazaflavin-dependent oxidoreductase (nitroreductase family)